MTQLTSVASTLYGPDKQYIEKTYGTPGNEAFYPLGYCNISVNQGGSNTYKFVAVKDPTTASPHLELTTVEQTHTQNGNGTNVSQMNRSGFGVEHNHNKYIFRLEHSDTDGGRVVLVWDSKGMHSGATEPNTTQALSSDNKFYLSETGSTLQFSNSEGLAKTINFAYNKDDLKADAHTTATYGSSAGKPYDWARGVFTNDNKVRNVVMIGSTLSVDGADESNFWFNFQINYRSESSVVWHIPQHISITPELLERDDRIIPSGGEDFIITVNPEMAQIPAEYLQGWLQAEYDEPNLTYQYSVNPTWYPSVCNSPSTGYTASDGLWKHLCCILGDAGQIAAHGATVTRSLDTNIITVGGNTTTGANCCLFMDMHTVRPYNDYKYNALELDNQDAWLHEQDSVGKLALNYYSHVFCGTLTNPEDMINNYNTLRSSIDNHDTTHANSSTFLTEHPQDHVVSKILWNMAELTHNDINDMVELSPSLRRRLELSIGHQSGKKDIPFENGDWITIGGTVKKPTKITQNDQYWVAAGSTFNEITYLLKIKLYRD